jgi:superfamily II DNA/RNA helicase
MLKEQHADQPAYERAQLYTDYRTGQARVLIATDLLACGLDIRPVTLIIQYDVPKAQESYMYRIGRGGLFGAKNTTIVFVTAEEKDAMRNIERLCFDSTI